MFSVYILNMIDLCKTYLKINLCRIFSNNWYCSNKVQDESSFFERCWPHAWRLFVIVNCLYFTCFMFSLVWNLKKHSDSTRQPHCRILYSLQKIKNYHEVFQSYRRDTLNTFFVNLLENIPFLTNLIDVSPDDDDEADRVDEICNDKKVQAQFTDKYKGVKYDKFHSFNSVARNTLNKHGPRQHHNKHCLSSRRKNMAVPSIVKTPHQKNESKYKRQFSFPKKTEYTTNFASLHYDSFESEGEDTKRHCPDCNHIRSRLYKQSCKHKFGRIQSKTCNVSYHDPYTSRSRKRNNINKYTIQCGDQNPRQSVCEHVTNELKPKRKRISLFSNEENCESTKQSSPEQTKTVKEHKKHTNLKENTYLSKEVLAKPSHNDSEQLYGTPWTKIDAQNKNFMPKNSVKYVYKNRPKTYGPKNHEMNPNLVKIVSDALKKVSKSIRHERRYCQRNYTW